MSRIEPTSYSTLMRLESFAAPPKDVKRRLIALLALVAYGFDPEEFGLSENDLPRRVTAEDLATLRRAIGGYFATQSAA